MVRNNPSLHMEISVQNIDTLVPSIYDLISKGKKITDESAKEFGMEMAKLIQRELDPDAHDGSRELRMSNFGTKCDRKLWYDVNSEGDGEPLKPNTLLTFMYGHVLEALILFLAKEAGRDVVGRQDTVDVEGVPGHRDAFIDGMLVDVKSANSRSFDKFKYHKLEQDDPFGYLDQLMLYLEAGQDDPRCEYKNEAAFLAIDKERGHLVLDRYPRKESSDEIRKRVRDKKRMVSGAKEPARGFMPVPHNKSGNLQLDLPCRYCKHKHTCWPGLRTFIYSSGPAFLTHVAKQPEVREVFNEQLEEEPA